MMYIRSVPRAAAMLAIVLLLLPGCSGYGPLGTAAIMGQISGLAGGYPRNLEAGAPPAPNFGLGLTPTRPPVAPGKPITAAAPCAAATTAPLGTGDNVLSFDDLCAVAEAVYDAVEANSAVPDTLAQIFGAFGVPVLQAEWDKDEIGAKLAAGELVVLDVQLETMAHGFHNGTFVDLDSFFAALAKAGVAMKDPPGALNRANFTGRLGLADLVGKSRIEPGEALPALVLALGHERVRREPSDALDPVWGDLYLDPLQFALLSYTFSHAEGLPRRRAMSDEGSRQRPNSKQASAHALWRESADAGIQRSGIKLIDKYLILASQQLPKPPGQLSSFMLKNIGRGIIVSLYGKIIEFPLGYVSSAKATVCASIILYSYKLDIVRQEPATGMIWHRQPDRPDRPYTADILAKLVFDFQPDPRFDIVIRLAGCRDLPKPGPVAGQEVEWRVDPNLANHGSLQPPSGVTDGHGQDWMSFVAVDERTPPELRDRIKSAEGWIEARAKGLLPGLRNLEVVIRGLGGQYGALPSEDSRRLVVNYYEAHHYVLRIWGTAAAHHQDPAIQLDSRAEFQIEGWVADRGETRWSAEGSKAWPIDGTFEYTGAGNLAYHSSGGPACQQPWSATGRGNFFGEIEHDGHRAPRVWLLMQDPSRSPVLQSAWSGCSDPAAAFFTALVGGHFGPIPLDLPSAGRFAWEALLRGDVPQPKTAWTQSMVATSHNRRAGIVDPVAALPYAWGDIHRRLQYFTADVHYEIKPAATDRASN